MILKSKKGTKMRKIEKLLRRKKGCTNREALAVLGWVAISIPQRAEQLGLKLRRQKNGRLTRYWAI
jgi:hypothetical protein